MITKKYRSSFLIAVPFLAASMVCWGAGGEIEAFAGGSTFDQGGGSHGTFGLTGGMKVTSAWSVFGEFSWEQLASESDSSSGVNVNASVNLGGGVAYNFGPLSKKVFPYALVAGGVGHFYGSGSASGNGTSVSISMPLANAGYLGAGGGTRIYLGKRWGIKPEIRVDRYVNSAFAGNTVTYTAGLFWEFGE